MHDIIEINNLCKSFGEVKAVNSVSFKVKKGELFAFLGVNGAGKSTTISIITSQLRADSGEVKICGEDLDCGKAHIKKRIGVVFQNSCLDSALSARDNLKSRAALYGIYGKDFDSRLSELATLLSFESFMNRPLSKLSGGQRRRIDIARALIHKPEILILDEPTTGLDPQTRKLLWDIIKSLRERDGLTVFLTTHYMEEATDADFVVILDNGKVVAEGTPLMLKNTYSGDFITLYGASEESLAHLNLPMEKLRDSVRLAVENTTAARELIIKHPELFSDFEITKGKMDDVFLAVTGRNLEGGTET